MGAVIKVEGLSKKFVIGHEQAEKYTSFRDVISNQGKRLLSLHKPKPSFTKEEFWALKDVNFEVNQGDRLGIIGRNGAGKSTLLKVLSRITEPTSGKITLKGKLASLLEVGTGFHPELTGRENIFLNGAILGMNRADIRRKFDEIVAFAEVEKFLDTPVKRYSSGMYVRLAFAVAAHLEPEILIVDEVLAVGDSEFQKKCLGKMEDVSKNQGRTVLFVSHNMGVIAQLCNKAIMLKSGSVYKDADVKTVVEAYIEGTTKVDHVYSNEDVVTGKPAYFNKIYASNESGAIVADFSFEEKIALHFEFTVNDSPSNLQVGIGLQDKFQNRIFTLLRPVTEFSAKENGRYQGCVELPNSIIAPNMYSFVFALWTRDGQIFDIVENVSPIKIHDSGTELSLYEGSDYGSVIIKPEWRNV